MRKTSLLGVPLMLGAVMLFAGCEPPNQLSMSFDGEMIYLSLCPGRGWRLDSDDILSTVLSTTLSTTPSMTHVTAFSLAVDTQELRPLSTEYGWNGWISGSGAGGAVAWTHMDEGWKWSLRVRRRPGDNAYPLSEIGKYCAGPTFVPGDGWILAVEGNYGEFRWTLFDPTDRPVVMPFDRGLKAIPDANPALAEGRCAVAVFDTNYGVPGLMKEYWKTSPAKPYGFYIYVVDLTGKEPKATLAGQLETATPLELPVQQGKTTSSLNMSFSPDGKKLIAAWNSMVTLKTTFYEIDAAGKEKPKELFSDSRASYACYMGDGRSVAYLRADPEAPTTHSQVMLWRPEAAQPKLVCALTGSNMYRGALRDSGTAFRLLKNGKLRIAHFSDQGLKIVDCDPDGTGLNTRYMSVAQLDGMQRRAAEAAMAAARKASGVDYVQAALRNTKLKMKYELTHAPSIPDEKEERRELLGMFKDSLNELGEDVGTSFVDAGGEPPNLIVKITVQWREDGWYQRTTAEVYGLAHPGLLFTVSSGDEFYEDYFFDDMMHELAEDLCSWLSNGWEVNNGVRTKQRAPPVEPAAGVRNPIDDAPPDVVPEPKKTEVEKKDVVTAPDTPAKTKSPEVVSVPAQEPAVRKPEFVYIDKDGKVRLSGYEKAGNFSKGLAPVSIGGSYGFIDTTGKVVIAPQFAEAGPFSDGVARVKVEAAWGYVDTTGARVIKPQYKDASEFGGGLARVKVGDMWALIDRKGTLTIPANCEELGTPSEGLVAFSREGKWGFIDKSGAAVIEPQFERAGAFSGGLAPACSGGKWGFVDKAGRWAVKPKYADARPFSEGLAAVGDMVKEEVKDPKTGRLVGFRNAILWGYIDSAGKEAIAPAYLNAGPFSEGWAPVCKRGEVLGPATSLEFIDKTGAVVLSTTGMKDNAGGFHDGLVWVEKETARKPSEDAKACCEKGDALLAKGDLDGATAQYREALRLKPDSAEAHCSLGGALFRKGDLNGAIAEEREAIRLKPDYFLAHYNLAVALDKSGDPEGALKEFLEANRLKPEGGAKPGDPARNPPAQAPPRRD